MTIELKMKLAELRAERLASARARYAAGEPGWLLSRDYGVSIGTIREWCSGCRPKPKKNDHRSSIVIKALAARNELTLAWSTS